MKDVKIVWQIIDWWIGGVNHWAVCCFRKEINSEVVWWNLIWSSVTVITLNFYYYFYFSKNSTSWSILFPIWVISQLKAITSRSLFTDISYDMIMSKHDILYISTLHTHDLWCLKEKITRACGFSGRWRRCLGSECNTTTNISLARRYRNWRRMRAKNYFS